MFKFPLSLRHLPFFEETHKHIKRWEKWYWTLTKAECFLLLFWGGAKSCYCSFPPAIFFSCTVHLQAVFVHSFFAYNARWLKTLANNLLTWTLQFCDRFWFWKTKNLLQKTTLPRHRPLFQTTFPWNLPLQVFVCKSLPPRTTPLVSQRPLTRVVWEHPPPLFRP